MVCSVFLLVGGFAMQTECPWSRPAVRKIFRKVYKVKLHLASEAL